MGLADRLKVIANSSAAQVGQSKPKRSTEASVTGYDKQTGQYLIKRDGAIETTQSATNGLIRIGDILPAIQGKLFSIPHCPSPPRKPSAPRLSTPSAVDEHRVYIAYLPISLLAKKKIVAERVVDDGTALGLNIDFDGNALGLNGLGDYNLFRRSGTLQSDFFYPRNLRVWQPSKIDFTNEGVDFSDPSAPAARTDESSAYEILKAVIDFVFPSDVPNVLASSAVLQLVEEPTGSIAFSGEYIGMYIGGTWVVPNTGYKWLKSNGININIDIEIVSIGTPWPGPVVRTDVCDSSITIITDYHHQYYISPFRLKRFLKSAFQGNGKKLIIIPLESPSTLPFSVEPIETVTLAHERGSWAYRIPIANAMLCGVASHGVGHSQYPIRFKRATGPEETYWHAPDGSPILAPELAYPDGQRAVSALEGDGSNNYSEVPGVSHFRYNNFRYDAPPAIRNQFWGVNDNYGLFWPPAELPTYAQASGQPQYKPLIESLLQSLGGQLYTNSSLYFSQLYEDDPLQTIYGDSQTPHYWIKGLTEANVDAVDLVALADQWDIPTGVARAELGFTN